MRLGSRGGRKEVQPERRRVAVHVTRRSISQLFKGGGIQGT